MTENEWALWNEAADLAVGVIVNVSSAYACPFDTKHDMARIHHRQINDVLAQILCSVEEVSRHFRICLYLQHGTHPITKAEPSTVARLMALKSQAMPKPGSSEGMA